MATTGTTKYSKKRINISPVGFEFDRIVKPLEDKKYDKIILVSHKGKEEDRATSYLELLKMELEGTEVEQENCDVNDLYDSLRLFYSILQKEKGNELWINLSSGSKIVAMAGMLSSMMFGEKDNPIPFYVVPEIQVRDKDYEKRANEFIEKMEKKYGKKFDKPESFGVTRTFVMPHFKIERTPEEIIDVLKIISEHGAKILNTELKNKLIEKGFIKPEKNNTTGRTTPFAAVKRKYIDKMKDFIIEYSNGKYKTIEINEEGKNHLKIYGEKNDD